MEPKLGVNLLPPVVAMQPESVEPSMSDNLLLEVEQFAQNLVAKSIIRKGDKLEESWLVFDDLCQPFQTSGEAQKRAWRDLDPDLREQMIVQVGDQRRQVRVIRLDAVTMVLMAMRLKKSNPQRPFLRACRRHLNRILVEFVWRSGRAEEGRAAASDFRGIFGEVTGFTLEMFAQSPADERPIRIDPTSPTNSLEDKAALHAAERHRASGGYL
jgi:hypothetical protein